MFKSVDCDRIAYNNLIKSVPNTLFKMLNLRTFRFHLGLYNLRERLLKLKYFVTNYIINL